jgi:hypothetical protein
MAISSLVVRSGIGSWGDIAHLITRGLDLGAVPPIWTDVANPSTTWATVSGPSNTWTDVAAPSTTWTTS